MRKFGFSVSFNTSKQGITSFGHKEMFVKKFSEDKTVFETNECILCLDGVIINKLLLLQSSVRSTWQETLEELYKTKGIAFVSLLRGSFSGFVFDKINQKVYVFSDQIGSKFLYYSFNGKSFFCSSMMDEVYENLKLNNIGYDLSVENSYLLLCYGYMIDGRTICDNIKKIKPGCYLEIHDGIIEEKRFFLIDNTPNLTLTEEDAIEGIDYYFRQAVKRQFDKDIEYGYKHMVALSGGLDSRMTCFVAHDLGYSEQLNYTFSQTDYWDEVVPKQIARDLKHEWIFKALDNGLWLYNIDEITKLTGGNVLYYGLSHAYNMYSKLNFDDYGLIHTGQLGDVVIGTFYSGLNPDVKFQLGEGAYSKTMLSRISNIAYTDYKNQEISKFYFRGFDGANTGLMSEYVFSESFSPFYDLDLMSFALSIPVSFRYKHGIYKKWILSKYPKAGDYVWEKMKCKITRKHGFVRGGVKIEEIPSLLIRKLSTGKARKLNANMNPIGYYIMKNSNLDEFLRSYTKYAEIVKDAELRSDLLKLSQSDNWTERIQASSLLSAVKIYY